MSRLPTDVRRTGADLRLAVLAAAAMVATLPGRTHGLGLVTEPLMADLGVDRVSFASLNFWATMIGATFCIPAGRLVDWAGTRITLAAALVALGGTVMAMARLSQAPASLPLPVPTAVAGTGAAAIAVPPLLFLLVLLTRGLGQSSLSVVSLAIIGKAAGDRPGRLIGIYSFLVAVGFMAAFMSAKFAFECNNADWRGVWSGIGLVIIGFAVMSPLLAPPPPAEHPGNVTQAGTQGVTLREAVATPAFWVFGLSTSFYGLVASGLSLFNQSLLSERGFERSVFFTVTAIAPFVGMVANLIGGWVAGSAPLSRIAACGLGLQALALACFPHVSSLTGVYAYAAAMAFAGGLLTVVFFSFWRQAYGVLHLGAIQGAAQLLTVMASAAGPVLLAVGQRSAGSYAPVLLWLAAISAAFAIASLVTPMPDQAQQMEPTSP